MYIKTKNLAISNSLKMNKKFPPFGKRLINAINQEEKIPEIFLFIGKQAAWEKAHYFHTWGRREFALVLPCEENSDDMLPSSYNWQMVKNLDVACYAFIDLSSIFIRCLAYELLNNGGNMALFVSKTYQVSLFKGVNYVY